MVAKKTFGEKTEIEISIIWVEIFEMSNILKIREY